MNFIEIFSENPFGLKGHCIALLGGGGKTALMRRMGMELSLIFSKVLLSSLTKSAYTPGEKVVYFKSLPDPNLEAEIGRENPLFVMRAESGEHKLVGLSAEALDELRGLFDISIIECDGARRLPLKAHKTHDPVIPQFANTVIVMAGAETVGTTCSDGLVHRPEVFAEKWGLTPDQKLTARFIARVLTSKDGYLRKVPHSQPLIYFVNKWDACPDQAVELARELTQHTDAPVFYGSVTQGILRSAR